MSAICLDCGTLHPPPRLCVCCGGPVREVIGEGPSPTTLTLANLPDGRARVTLERNSPGYRRVVIATAASEPEALHEALEHLLGRAGG